MAAGAKDRTAPLGEVTFRCPEPRCRHRWVSEPEQIEDDPQSPDHPWRYFATCPACRAKAPQAAWERSLMVAHSRATGPTSEAGKARSAANLDGHPTPEEARRTRFNAMKHGLYAKEAMYFPAKPGRYAQCEGCPHLNAGCGEDMPICVVQAQTTMRYLAAYDRGDPKMLQQLSAEWQARLRSMADAMLATVLQEGVTLKTVAYSFDKDGSFHRAEWIDEDGARHEILEVHAHPLIKHIIELTQKNNMSLADANMTARTAEASEQLRGFLDAETEDQQTSRMLQRRNTEALEQLVERFDRSRARAAKDPVVIEHDQGDD